MPENNNDWGHCHECNNKVKRKNLKGHFKKVHPEISENELKTMMKSRKTNRGTRNVSRAEKRKEMELENKRRNTFFGILGIVVFSVLIIGAIIMFTYSDGGSGEDSLNIKPQPAEEIPEVKDSDEIRISTAEVDDGKAHYYSYDSDGVNIRYFIIKSSDGVYRAAFDACDECYRAKKGYRQDGDDMVCNNCGLKFESNKINEVKGGCNPGPLKRTVDGLDVVIKLDDLDDGRWYFE